MVKFRICVALWASSLLLTGASTGRADPVADFYAGKSITMLIGNGEGGGTDVAGRLIARHFSRMIPGNPTIIAKNMPASSGLRATEFLYNVAPRDGTVLTFVGPYVVVEKVVRPELKFDPQKLSWVGRLTTQTTHGMIWHTSPITSLDQVKSRETFMTANGATGSAAMVPWALNRIVGTKFKVLLGYPSANAAALALERGEADGNGSVTSEFLESKPDWLANKMVRFIYTIGFERTARAPDAPTIVELAQDEADRNAMKLLASSSAIGRILFGPPDVPSDRAKALSDGFKKLMQDPAFLADAKKLRIEVEPMYNDGLQKIVDELLTFPPEVIERMNVLTRAPN